MNEIVQDAVVAATSSVMALMAVLLNLKAGSSFLKRFTYLVMWGFLILAIVFMVKLVIKTW